MALRQRRRTRLRSRTGVGQLVTYLSHRQAHLAIWILEEARPEHVKAVETLNQRGVGRIWMVTVRAVRIGDSPAAPLFTVVVQPPDVEAPDPPELTPTHVKRDFMSALFEQARDEKIDSPFRDLAPRIDGILQVRARRGAGLVYRVAVTRRQARVVLTNTVGKWLGAFKELEGRRAEIDAAFKTAGLPGTLEWYENVKLGRWVIEYTVDAGCEDETGRADKMRELNQASAALKRVFQPHIDRLPPELEEAASPEDLAGVE